MLNTGMDIEADKTKLVMGLIIKSLREEIVMSRYALAKNAGVDYSWLRRFENGKSGIRVETLIALARGLNTPAAKIIELMEHALAEPDKWLIEH